MTGIEGLIFADRRQKIPEAIAMRSHPRRKQERGRKIQQE